MEREQPAFWEKHALYFLLIGIGFLVYFNSLFGGLVWDDIPQVSENYLVQSPGNIPSFFLGSTFIPTSGNRLGGYYYKPLLPTWFATIYALFGPHPFFFHLFQVALHVFNAVLVFVFLKKLLKEKLAFLLALVFLVHPMNVEAVSYISGVNDPLYFFFGILALVLSVKEHISLKRAFVIGFLLLCSLLSKETGVLFLIILVLYQIIFRYRKFHRVQTILLAAVPFLVYAYLRFFVAKIAVQKVPDVPIGAISLMQRVFTMPAIVLFYLKTFFFPKDLFILQYWIITQPSQQFYLSLLIDCVFFLVITLLGIWIYRRRNILFPVFLFFTTWFLIGVGMHLQLIPLDMTVSDRWFYFPMVGMLGMIGVSAETIQHPGVRLRNTATIAAIAVLILFFLKTIIQNTYWQDDISLYSYNLQNKIHDAGHDAGVESYLAAELAYAGRFDEAQKHLENLITRYPVSGGSYNNLVSNYDRVMFISDLAQLKELEGQIPQAKILYKKILDTDGTGNAYYALALITIKKEGNPQDSKKLAMKGLQRYPNAPYLWEVLAIADFTLGNRQDALIEAKKAVNILPSPEIEEIYNRILNNDHS